MVSHFHYDPVWWNTQRGLHRAVAANCPDVPGVDRLRPPFVRTAFDLVRAHLDAARQDEDYRFVLAEVDYLKPYWDVFVDDRADLRRMLREGRVELVGGMYNEPNTNLTHPESTIRNAVLRRRLPARRPRRRPAHRAGCSTCSATTRPSPG